MTQLTVRKVSQESVDGLRRRAAANGRFAEVEHREIPRASLLGATGDFAIRAGALHRRLRSSVGSTNIIRTGRYGES